MGLDELASVQLLVTMVHLADPPVSFGAAAASWRINEANFGTSVVPLSIVFLMNGERCTVIWEYQTARLTRMAVQASFNVWAGALIGWLEDPRSHIGTPSGLINEVENRNA
jgi:hypothetical protein